MTIIVFQILKKHFREVFRGLTACTLNSDVEFTVGTHLVYISLHTVTRGNWPKHLAVVHKTGILIVYNNLKAKISLLPHKQVDLVTMGIWRDITTKVMLNLCRRHHTIAFVVDTYMHNITLSTFHPLLLLTERAEKVFHKSPIKKSAEIIDPSHLKTHKIANLGKRFQGGGNRSLVLV